MDLTRDTWVSAVAPEADGNNGGAARLKFKGIQEFSMVDVDPTPLRGKTVTAAELHMRSAATPPLRRVTVSTLATDWTEGTATSYQPQPGAASFRWARQGAQPWAYAGSDVTAATLSQGNTLWRFADATPPDADGWQTIAVDPRVIAARVAGVGFGFAVVDDVGSEYERSGNEFKYHLFPNRFAFSREQSNAKPYFTVTVGGEDHEPPGAPTLLKQATDATLPAGEAVVEWVTPVDRGGSGTRGYLATYKIAGSKSAAIPIPQYLVPPAGEAGQTVAMCLRDLPAAPGADLSIEVRAVDGAGNASASATLPHVVLAREARAIRLASPPPCPAAAAALPAVGGVTVAIVDALEKVNPTTGETIPNLAAAELSSNGLWSAADRTIHLYAARNEFVDFQVILRGAAASVDATLNFPDHAAEPVMFRLRNVDTKIGPLPDPLVPLKPLDVKPALGEAVIAELYVPHDATAGDHAGTLVVTADGQALELKVVLHVWDFSLPDVLSFIPEMNCYGLPDGQELAYHRLAHAHRTNLNCLGYSWKGVPREGWAPRWDGHAFDWTSYDQRFGPLFDGSAFADLPRKGVPVTTAYLPLNENWPVPIEPHFKGGYWADAAFDAEYPRQFSAACEAFARHFRERGWARTVAEFYLNNKVYFKADRWDKCSAPWVFDEPRDAQDFWALRYYGTLFHAAVDPVRGDAQLGFRCDVSYPQWQRDFLDGLLDVNVCGGGFRPYNRLVLDRKARNREVTFNYGTSNDVTESNVQPAAWCLDAWSLGADGVVPWQTVGDENAWKHADPLAIFYPSADGPVPSVRLKSYRRGQQDVEYLELLAKASGANRQDVADLVRRELKLVGTVAKKSEDDAGVVNYAGVSPAELWRLRVRIGATLDALHARAEPRDWRLPRRDVSKLPAVGYVGS